MICPKCQFEQKDSLPECLRCGIVFAKFQATAGRAPHHLPSAEDDAGAARTIWLDLFLPIPDEVNPLSLAAKAFLLAALAVWGAGFMFASIESNYAGRSFMHLVNLPFHEAGHIIFSPFGRLIHYLGGTLGQLLMPAVGTGVLLFRTRDPFGAAVAQWWLAESFMDIAPYINDARSLKLILLGGVTGKDVADYHDWEFILGHLHMLSWDHTLARCAQLIGISLMLAAIGWAAMQLWMQAKAWRAAAHVV
jgi:hypothetical protein